MTDLVSWSPLVPRNQRKNPQIARLIFRKKTRNDCGRVPPQIAAATPAGSALTELQVARAMVAASQPQACPDDLGHHLFTSS
ncbi:MAG: hypothetical protein P4M07_00170 [Xanthobacteraceae bacterium]|nr:hypothetical protein [Xanthobacteraceae bacterium]